jgi:hypothetical protein
MKGAEFESGSEEVVSRDDGGKNVQPVVLRGEVELHPFQVKRIDDGPDGEARGSVVVFDLNDQQASIGSEEVMLPPVITAPPAQSVFEDESQKRDFLNALRGVKLTGFRIIDDHYGREK